MTLPRWLGITGYAGSGKDTLAHILSELAGYKRFALADRLKEMVYELNPMISPNPVSYGYRLQRLVDDYGWDAAKRQFPEVRRLLQVFGVQMRGTNPEFWLIQLDQAAAEYRWRYRGAPPSDRPVVVPDIRFLNEAAWIRGRGGKVIRVTRPGVGPLNDHESEQGIPDHLIDYTIHNDGTPDDLATKVSDLLRELNPDAVTEANAALNRAWERRD